LLFDNESSLDQALSNNLRHGVIVPRFVRAFNESVWVATDAQENLGELNDTIEAGFGVHGKHIRKLQEFVIQEVTQFKDYWLTIDRQGDFYNRTKEMIAEILAEAALERTPLASWTLAAVIVEKFKESVSFIVEKGHSVLSEDVKSSIMDEIQRTRVICNTSRSSVFFDMFETYLRDAFDDVTKWLGLVKIETNVRDFALEDLVHFEAMSLIFSDIKKLRVRCYSYERRGSNIRRLVQSHKLRGPYFEAVQEIVHNLISNAYKYSGLEMETDIEFSTIDDSSSLTFRCVNSFAEKQAAKISDNQPEVLKILRQPRSEQRPKDVMSGFGKIKNVCNRIFGREVTISVAPLSPRSRRYIVEIAIPNGAEEAIA